MGSIFLHGSSQLIDLEICVPEKLADIIHNNTHQPQVR